MASRYSVKPIWCYGHNINLAVKDTLKEIQLFKDTLSLVNELIILFQVQTAVYLLDVLQHIIYSNTTSIESLDLEGLSRRP